MFLLFASQIASESFNLTSFAVLSDAGGESFEMIEWDDAGGGGVHWTEL